MPIRKPKPTSPGMRFVSYPDFGEITKTEPERTLVEGLTKSGGRNSYGRKTSRHRGGGAKRLYRRVDFKRRKDDVVARVAAIEYDPNRTAYIALLHYVDGVKSYILAPARLTVGMQVMSGENADIAVGNCLPLGKMPTGTVVHNVELQPGRGGQMGRSADGEGGRDGHAPPPIRGDAAGSGRLPGDRRIDRELRPPERQSGQGRSQAAHGCPAADAGNSDEPGRPPARRWRGFDDLRASSGHPVGRSDIGLQDT